MKKTNFMKIATLSAFICTLMTTFAGGFFAPTASAAQLYRVHWPTTNYQTVSYYWSHKTQQITPVNQYIPVNVRIGTSTQRYYVPIQSAPSTISNYPVPVQSTPAPTPAPAPAPTSTPAGNVTADQQQAINLMNADRAANGLPPLKVDGRLVALGQRYAEDMINRNFFSHTNPEGQSPFDRMKADGISYQYAGENIAINSSIKGAENAFMNSSGHRDNILNSNYTKVGIGVAHASDGMVYVAQEFIGN